MRQIATPFFRVWWRASRSMTLGVRVLAVDDEGRVLLVRHTYVKGWHFPGGGVERGETAVAAATRELMEEGGVAPTAPLVLLGFYSNHAAFPNDHIVLFRAPAWTESASTPDPREIAEYGFYPRDRLPEGATEGVRRRLAELFDGAPASDVWSPKAR